MRRFFAMLVFALLALSVNVEAIEDYSATSYLDLDATWSSTLTTTTGTDARLSSLEAHVSLVPETYTTIPESRLENGSIVFSWDRLQRNYDYEIRTKTRSELTGGLERSEPWPLRDRMTQIETELIDYNDPNVRRFAADIAQGETDALRLAVRVAEAVRSEITYNLSTLNAEATYPASEVLERGEGVCDEITVLYIATLRALGVPARYVSGYAFTNIFESDGSWEGHGWAEVLIAGEWVPFDLTYAEYVHLSPAHLPIKRSEDAQGTRISYTWYGNNVDISARELESDITILRAGPEVRFGRIDAAFAHERVGPGWNELEITVHNELDSFIAPVLRLSRTQGLELDSEHVIIVPPFGSRTIRLPVEIRETLRPRYEYTFPVSISARGFAATQATFLASTRAPSYGEPTYESVEEFHPDLSLSCTDVIGLPGSEQASTCTLLNTGNRNLDLRVCGDRCVDADVLIGESRTIAIPVELGDGRDERRITVIGDVRGETTINASGRAPAQVSMDVTSEGRDVRIVVTSSAPVNGTIVTTIGEHRVEEAFTNARITIPSDSFGLSGTVSVRATYTDVDGEHTIEKDVQVSQTIIEWTGSRLTKLLSLF